MSDGRAGPAPAWAAWAALAVAGLLFWFLVGFPFGHHNESYEWVSWISSGDAGSVVWHPFFGAGFRPLAMALAWSLFHVAGGSLVPVQLFNAAVTLLAWGVLAAAAPFRRAFALAALVAGGVLFSGYIYLFHLHGVFYGPVLLWLAFAVRATGRPLGRGTLLVLGATALAAALVHTFAFAFLLAFLAGSAFDRGWLRGRRGAALAIALVATGALLVAVVAPHLLRATGPGLLALATSLRAVEVNRVVTIVLAGLALATVAGTRWGGGGARAVALAVTAAGAVALVAADRPMAFLWLAAGMTKVLLHRRFTAAALLAASLALPYAGGTGSPTYAVFALALLAWITALDAGAFERALEGLRPAHAWAAAGALAVLALVVRSGADVPLVTRLARPVLAERERTRQGEDLLRAIVESPWRKHPVRLAVDAGAPTEAGGAIDRGTRPPSNQICIDAWLRHVRGAPDVKAAPIVLTFGGTPPAGRRVAFVEGRQAGDASAVLVARDTSRAAE